MDRKTIVKNLFLIDGIGALVSAIFLGIVLVSLHSLIGMPRNILYLLAVIPCFFAVYSFTCHFAAIKNWQPYLKIIAVANLLYCCLTLGLVLGLREQLTYLGIGYFIIEIIIVVALAIFEWRTAQFSQRAKAG